MQPPSSKRKRARERGAAFPEAVIVISVLVLFFGLLDYVKASYAEKILEQDRTRREVLDYASHDCKGTSGFQENSSGSSGKATSSGKPPLDTGINASGAGADANGAVEGNEGAKNKSSGAMGKATSKTSGKARGGGRTRDIKSESYALCNEHPYDGGLKGFMSYITGKASF